MNPQEVLAQRGTLALAGLVGALVLFLLVHLLQLPLIGLVRLMAIQKCRLNIYAAQVVAAGPVGVTRPPISRRGAARVYAA